MTEYLWKLVPAVFAGRSAGNALGSTDVAGLRREADAFLGRGRATTKR